MCNNLLKYIFNSSLLHFLHRMRLREHDTDPTRELPIWAECFKLPKHKALSIINGDMEEGFTIVRNGKTPV